VHVSSTPSTSHPTPPRSSSHRWSSISKSHRTFDFCRNSWNIQSRASASTLNEDRSSTIALTASLKLMTRDSSGDTSVSHLGHTPRLVIAFNESSGCVPRNCRRPRTFLQIGVSSATGTRFIKRTSSRGISRNLTNAFRFQQLFQADQTDFVHGG